MEKIKVIPHKFLWFPFLYPHIKTVHFFIQESFCSTLVRAGALNSIFSPIIVPSILPCASRISSFPYFSNAYKIVSPWQNKFHLINFVCSLRHSPVWLSFTPKLVRKEVDTNFSCFLYIALFLIPFQFDLHIYQFTRIVFSKKNHYRLIEKLNRLFTIIIYIKLHTAFYTLFLSSWNTFLSWPP